MIIHDIIVFSSYHLRKSSGKEPRLLSFSADKSLFTSSVCIDSLVDTSIDTWQEYVGFNCIIHTTPLLSSSINTSNKIQMCSGPIQKYENNNILG